MKFFSVFSRRILPVLLTVLLLACCLPVLAEESLTSTFDVLKDPEYGAISIGCSIEDFLATGFQPGDSCDVELSNGFRMEDVPVYTGYYTRTGGALISLYPGFEHPSLTRNNIGDMWDQSGAEAGDTVTVTLREAGKYLAVEEGLGAVYSDDRSTYASDIEFSNFRELSGGKLRPGMFFRGTSPINDRHNRAAITDGLIREAGIGFILDLADSAENAATYPNYAGSRFEELSGEGQTACLALKAAYRSPEYAAALAEGFRAMMKQDQPVYIHCLEGKDRTGFVCILLEALAGATNEEIERDYMITYDNYYGINPTDTPEKYDVNVQVHYLDMVEWLAGVPEGTDLTGRTFEAEAGNYLKNAGMTDGELDALTRFVTGERRTGPDWDILYGIQSLHGDFLDRFFLVLTKIAGDYGHLWLILGALFCLFPKTRKCGFAVLLGYALVFALGQYVLKDLIARPRPCQIDQSVALLLKRPSSYSCPSTHSAWAFAAATAVLLNHRKTGFAVLAVSLLIAFSRLWLFVHFPTDVLAGMALGILCGFAADCAVKALAKKIPARKASAGK